MTSSCSSVRLSRSVLAALLVSSVPAAVAAERETVFSRIGQSLFGSKPSGQRSRAAREREAQLKHFEQQLQQVSRLVPKVVPDARFATRQTRPTSRVTTRSVTVSARPTGRVAQSRPTGEFQSTGNAPSSLGVELKTPYGTGYSVRSQPVAIAPSSSALSATPNNPLPRPVADLSTPSGIAKSDVPRSSTREHSSSVSRLSPSTFSEVSAPTGARDGSDCFKPAPPPSMQTEIPTAIYLRPGRVSMPFPPYAVLNVEGMASGSLAMDPTTEKKFRVP